VSRQIETVLADWREKASAARMLRHAHDAELIEELVKDVADAAEPFMTWLGEPDAVLYSGHAVPWLRARFNAWEREGLARWSVRGKRERQYLQCILPRRADLDAVRADAAREAAHG
jgi:hypothetical protein